MKGIPTGQVQEGYFTPILQNKIDYNLNSI